MKVSSNEILNINAAYEKFYTDDVNNHLRAEIIKANEAFDKLLSTSAALLIDYLNDKSADENVKLFILSELNNNREAFLPQLLQLEIDKQKNFFPDSVYFFKKDEIEKRHIEITVPPEHLRDKSTLMASAESSFEKSKEAEEIANVTHLIWKYTKELAPIIIALFTSLLMYQTFRIARQTLVLAQRKDSRETYEFVEMFRLKKEELEKRNVLTAQQIEEKDKELDKSAEKKKIIIARR